MPPKGETAPGTGPNAEVADSTTVTAPGTPSKGSSGTGSGSGSGSGSGISNVGVPAGRTEPPAATVCGPRNATPILDEETSVANGGVGLTSRVAQPEERHGGLDKAAIRLPFDRAEMTTTRIGWPESPLIVPSRLPWQEAIRFAGDPSKIDTDGDCLSDADEAKLGTDPKNPDSDGDGWFDGACNERRVLVLESMRVRETQDWNILGGDKAYVIADDVRWPNGDGLDDHWRFHSGDAKTLGTRIAQRTRGAWTAPLRVVRVEGWEDDFEIFNSWTVDDWLYSFDVDLGAFANGARFTRRTSSSDYDYELTFRVDVERFADPNPKGDGDADGDGIKDSAEARVARELGGIVDPTRADVLVEVDWMKGHAMRTEAKRQVVTQLMRHGIALFVTRDEELPKDPCLSVPEAKTLYAQHFGMKKYDAFRYAVVGEQIWNDASGVAWGDMFLVDDSTWWIGGSVQPQAGTFIHELGHTMGLTKEMFHLIDSIGWISYYSAMNYTFQALLVDYSDEGSGGTSLDHDDWAAVVPGHALRWSFGLVKSTETGICK